MVNLKSRRVLGMVGATVGLILVVAGLVYSGVIPLGPTLSCIGVSGSTRTFTIIANLGGFNDSKTQPPSPGFGVGLGVWPIMNVSRCDHVTIRLANTATQTHSIVVGVLAMEPLLVPAGQTLDLNFLAYKTGHFRVYCTVTACTVHEYMQNAQLNVT
jgi:hypothetical protein